MELSKILSNFDLIFCVIRVLHKKSSKSLRVFLRAPFSWKLLKIDLDIAYSFIKSILLLKVFLKRYLGFYKIVAFNLLPAVHFPGIVCEGTV